MKKARVDRLIKAAAKHANLAGFKAGVEHERKHQIAYLEARPGTLDMAPPPAQLYREIACQPSFRHAGVFDRTPFVRLRAVANVLQLQPDPRLEPQFVRFFTWEPCG